MIVTNQIRMDVLHRGSTPQVDAVQGDSCSRQLQLQLFAGSETFTVPEGTRVSIRYAGTDGSCGEYDTLPDGTQAWYVEGNTVTIVLVPQLCTVPGVRELSVCLCREGRQLSTFRILLHVQGRPESIPQSGEYFCLKGFLPQPEQGAKTGQILQVTQVDGEGKILALQAVDGGGLSVQAVRLLMSILRSAVYTSDQSGTIAALEEAFAASGSQGDTDSGNNGGEETPDVPVIPEEPEEPAIRTYEVVNTMYFVRNNNVVTQVQEDAAYTATLTAEEGYVLDSVRVTMGGVDITASVYADGEIRIASVTGDIAIFASAVEIESNEHNGWESGQAYSITWTADKKLDNTSGAEVDAVGSMKLTDYLPCYGADRIVGSGMYTNYGLWFYDADKNFVKRSTGSKADINMVPVPDTAYYVRGYARIATAAPVMIPYLDELLTDTTVPETGKCYRMNWNDYAYLNTNTNELSTIEENRNSVTDFGFCYGAASIIAPHAIRSFVLFYDAEKAFISIVTLDTTTSTVTVPDNAMYFRYYIADATANYYFTVDMGGA